MDQRLHGRSGFESEEILLGLEIGPISPTLPTLVYESHIPLQTSLRTEGLNDVSFFIFGLLAH